MTSRPSPEVPLSAAILVIGVVTLTAFALAPSVVAQGGFGLDSAGGAPGDGGLDMGGLLDGSFFLDMPLPLQVTLAITLVGVTAALAFMGGTKFVNAQNVLENDARRSIFDYIKAHPGVHLRAAATALDLSTTNVLWHLRKLETAKLVSSKKFEGYKVFYPVEGGVASRDRAIGSAVLRNDNAQQILEYLLGQPQAHQREIARALEVNHGTVRWHLRKLLDASLVHPVKDGASTSYYVSDLGIKLLADHGVQEAKAHIAGAMHAPGASQGPGEATGSLGGPHAHHTIGTGRAAAHAWGPDEDED